MTATNQDVRGKEWMPTMWRWLLFTVAGSVVLQWWNRDVLNTDAIAYLRIAEYYSGGNFDLAVNGYWGPLLSWLMVPFLKVGLPPLIAARTAMLISTLVFAIGANRMMSGFGLARSPHVPGLMLCCSAAAIWGSQNITPDLLLAGLALIAIPFTRRAFDEPDSRSAGYAGIAWGTAFLAKAIALPWAAMVIGIYTLVQLRRRKLDLSVLGTICAGAAMIALPWITMLSVRAGHFTFSTSGRIAHTLAGPAGEDRYHPTFVTLHEPGAGRLTSWENPVELPYRPWSPFESRDNFAHQIRVAAGNAFKILFIITSIVPVWPLIFAFAFLRRSKFDWNAALGAAFPLVLLCLIYLPVYLTINEQRYFYIALPVLWIALNSTRNPGVALTSRSAPSPRNWVQTTAFAAIAFSLVASTIMYQFPARTAGKEARELARWLDSNQHTGPIAGSGMRPGGRTGLYIAWFLGEPWLGDSRSADARSFVQSGAMLLIFSDDDPLIADLKRSAGVRKLELPPPFADKLVVFEIKP